MMTNSIRLFVAASLHPNGEAQRTYITRFLGACRRKTVTHGKPGEKTRPKLRGGKGWLETECSEDSML